MKKIATISALASVAALIAAAPANAALTTALPAGEALWVMPVGHPVPGDIRIMDPVAGTFSDFFVGNSTMSSDSWIVGADYDEATNAVYWIRNFGLDTESIVRYNVGGGTETSYLVDDNATYDIRGIDATDGVIRVSTQNGDGPAIGTLVFDDATETVSLTDIRNVGAFSNQPSALAIDPTNNDVYMLDYNCELVRINDDNSQTYIDRLDDYPVISGDCVGLDFDSNGRAWATTGGTGRPVSFDPDDLAGTLEQSDWSAPSEEIYGEAIFIAPSDPDTSAPVVEPLASTGFDASGAIAGGLALLTAGVTVVVRRRKA